ncbi:MAG: TIM-barrel domain-containing protein [Roseiflexaceae bacterium]
MPPTRLLRIVLPLLVLAFSAIAVAAGASAATASLLAAPERCAALSTIEGLPHDLFAGRLSYWDSAGNQIDVTHPALAELVALSPGDACTDHWRAPAGSRSSLTFTIAVQPAAQGIVSLRITPAEPSMVRAIDLCLPLAHHEHFFGLGERFSSLELAGRVLENWTADPATVAQQPMTYAPTPFLLSSRGYGVLLDTTAHATFDLRATARGCYAIRVDAPELHLYLIGGPHPQTVVERHARLVGLPPLPPPWAFGVWKNLIGGAARVEADVRRLRQDEVPIDAVWIYDATDERVGFGWPWPIYGPIAPGAYPNLPGLIRRLHAQNLKVLGYLTPFLYPGSAGFAEARRRGFLVQAPDGQPSIEPWSFGERAYLDFTNPQATAWWQTRVRFALVDLGFDGAMLDFGEGAPADGRYASGQPGELVHNQYPLLYQRAAHEAAQAAKPGDMVFLARGL